MLYSIVLYARFLSRGREACKVRYLPHCDSATSWPTPAVSRRAGSFYWKAIVLSLSRFLDLFAFCVYGGKGQARRALLNAYRVQGLLKNTTFDQRRDTPQIIVEWRVIKRRLWGNTQPEKKRVSCVVGGGGVNVRTDPLPRYKRGGGGLATASRSRGGVLGRARMPLDVGNGRQTTIQDSGTAWLGLFSPSTGGGGGFP